MCRRYGWLALPSNKIEAAQAEAAAHHPHPGHDFVRGTCRVQAVRSVSDWSQGVLTEHSVQNAYIQLILEAEHFVYIGTSFYSSEMRTIADAPL